MCDVIQKMAEKGADAEDYNEVISALNGLVKTSMEYKIASIRMENYIPSGHRENIKTNQGKLMEQIYQELAVIRKELQTITGSLESQKEETSFEESL